MSLAETQQIFSLLQDIMKMLDGIEVKTEKALTDMPRTKEAITSKREVLRLIGQLNQVLSIMGLPKELQATIGVIQQLTLAANAAFISMKLLESGTMLGLFSGILGLGLTMINLTSIAGNTLEGY